MVLGKDRTNNKINGKNVYEPLITKSVCLFAFSKEISAKSIKNMVPPEGEEIG